MFFLKQWYVKKMDQMFYSSCSNLPSLNLSGWKIQ